MYYRLGKFELSLLETRTGSICCPNCNSSLIREGELLHCESCIFMTRLSQISNWPECWNMKDANWKVAAIEKLKEIADLVAPLSYDHARKIGQVAVDLEPTTRVIDDRYHRAASELQAITKQLERKPTLRFLLPRIARVIEQLEAK